ncbi:hypothetical protein EK904_000673 [Melospiza melodia maxima]|nr:hypothetical protein EK904_000673 [Melospiza melodia maxima]
MTSFTTEVLIAELGTGDGKQQRSLCACVTFQRKVVMELLRLPKSAQTGSARIGCVRPVVIRIRYQTSVFAKTLSDSRCSPLDDDISQDTQLLVVNYEREEAPAGSTLISSTQHRGSSRCLCRVTAGWDQILQSHLLLLASRL